MIEKADLENTSDFSSVKKRKPTAITGLQIIEYLSKNPKGAKFGDIATEIKMDPGQTHRLLAAMQEDGWVASTDGSGVYYITARVIRLGAIYTSRLDLSFHAKPFIENLFESTRETVFLGELRENEVVCVDRMLSDRTLSVLTKVGETWPLCGTSIGSAIIASKASRLGDSAVEDTKTTEDIPIILSQGFARDFGRYRNGVESVSAVILDATGIEVGGIAVTAPVNRLSGDDVRKIGDLVSRAAVGISERLGWNGVTSRKASECNV